VGVEPRSHDRRKNDALTLPAMLPTNMWFCVLFRAAGSRKRRNLQINSFLAEGFNRVAAVGAFVATNFPEDDEICSDG